MADLSQEFYGVDSELIEQGTQIVSGLVQKANAKKAAKQKASQIKALQAKIKQQEATKAQLAQKAAARKATQTAVVKSNQNSNVKTILIIGGVAIAISLGVILILKR